jgi:type VI secretion system secreted protein Hcp
MPAPLHGFDRGAGDMFLKVTGASSGVIKGESQDAEHKGEIDIVSWSWGMQVKSTLGGGTATGKASMHDLKLVKRVDVSSTALMAALKNNEVIKKAVLTLRKAGTSHLEYLKITIEQGRVTGLTIETGDEEGRPTLFENLSFSFNTIQIEYVPQLKDGQRGGSTMFTDTWGDG